MSERSSSPTRLSGNEGQAYAKQNLTQIKVDSVNWKVLWKHQASGEYWKEFFPQSELQGGGPPEFIRISLVEAREEFGEIE